MTKFFKSRALFFELKPGLCHRKVMRKCGRTVREKYRHVPPDGAGGIMPG
jgi:hypothetical protein